MNNNDLADVIAAGHGLTKTDARKVVDAVFAAVADAASQGDEISLNGFGKFKVKESAAREGRNPSTGAPIQIAESKKLALNTATSVKDKTHGGWAHSPDPFRRRARHQRTGMTKRKIHQDPPEH